ncbi:MAG: hypothetical protein IAE77_00460 [Prosthecobacter sp.]|jgi:hypothetical protein|uniref:hypothetical protein n=1 Tax=Prosthecobacter sp. TaxID=1965333 RepID=UPI0019EF75C2|nr:hypothetical protein [Prosthecobacter sp.]MBE2281911.1 hypothetical protein [Prosthecobacter sp.]
MARQQQGQLTPKQQALRDLEDARVSLAHHATLAAAEWSPRAMVARSFEKHRALWLGGAALAGLVVMRLAWPSARSDGGGSSSRGAGRAWLPFLLSPVIGLVRKNALGYASRLIESYLHQRQVSPNAPDTEAV